MSIHIKISSLVSRTAVVAGFLICIILFALSATIYFGSGVARGATELAAAEFAVRLAPDDAEGYLAAAAFLESSMRAEDQPKALRYYEQAAALEPNNYIYWYTLGNAKERSGDPEAAEKAMRRAESLAPNYSEVLWALGNILVRNGKDDEGFQKIRKAVEGNMKFAVPAASLSWDLNEGDVGRVEKAVGDSLPVRAALARLLAGRERFDESLKMWDSIPAEKARTDFSDSGEKVLLALLKAKKYVEAVKLKAELDDSKSPAVGKVTNPGFEEDVSVKPGSGFEWIVAQGGRPKAGVSVEQKHSGEKSLVLIFDGRGLKSAKTVTQVIAVVPGNEYTFNAFYRSELQAEKTLFWEIVDVATGDVIARTDPFSASSGWTPVSASFTSPEDSEAVIIRLARQSCLANECSIKGKLWIDDVTLK